jgi:hypothetical protein
MTRCSFDTADLSMHPSASLVAFVKRQVRNAELFAGPERRADLRQLIVVPAIVQPVDAQCQPIGEPVAMVTRDITAKGVGLVHEEPLWHERVALRIDPDRLEDTEILIADVVWNRPLGPFCSIGCEVVARIENSPLTALLQQGHCREPGRMPGVCTANRS